MSATVLEQMRLRFETAEVYEAAICEELNKKPNGQKAKVLQQHTIAKLLDQVVSSNKELSALYSDEDGLFKEEKSVIQGANVFTSFYEALEATQKYHERFPNLKVEQVTAKLAQEAEVSFSGEEVFGKYLDLHAFFVQYCNLPNVPARGEQDYMQYLDKFFAFFHIQENTKGAKAYISYLNDLYNYLQGFLHRVQPLLDLDEFVKEWKTTFEAKWTADKIPGWKAKAVVASGASGAASEPQSLRLGMFNTQQELEALGAERLKQALEAMGLKCGGTLQDRAARLWSVRGKKPQEIPQKLKAKTDGISSSSSSSSSSSGSSSGGGGGGGREEANYSDSRMQTAWTEAKIASICELMMDTVIATRRHAEKQQARTVEEKEAELHEEEFGMLPDVAGGEEEDADDEGPIYNPLNLPLGWDGKPIPYWMYKLHGLGVEFKCEICGNQSYWGRRAFDRHFQEFKHSHSMRALGIPNTKHFHDITQIQDAYALYAKIKESLTTEQFKGDVDEEFEDTEGNILNRKTYEDLARQGLL